MKNLITVQRLKIISLGISTLAILLEVIALLDLPKLPDWVLISISQIKILHFQFFPANFLFYYNFNSGLSTNFLNLIFFSSMFVGAILLWSKGNREIRLLRFCYGVLLIVNSIYVSSTVIVVLKEPSSLMQGGMMYFILGCVKVIVTLYISWFALMLLDGMQTIVTPGEGQPFKSVEASGWHRLFHLAVDTILVYIIFMPFFAFHARDFLEKMSEGVGERPVILLVLIAGRMLYYPFFERLLGATPAKMFSESRVVDRHGNPVSLDVAIYRTISRFVPFEPISFLIGEGGWHDRWTDTHVVKEVRKGVRGGIYFLIVPALLVVGGLGYAGHSIYQNHKSQLAMRESHLEKIAELESHLNGLNTNSVVQLLSSSYETLYLKAEDISNDEIYCSVFSPEPGSTSPYAAGEYYKSRPESFSKILISRNDLMESYQRDYNVYLASNRKSLLNDEKTYEIKDIFQLDMPKFIASGSGSKMSNVLTLNLENCGWGGIIKEIKTISGEAVFHTTGDLPFTVDPSNQAYGCEAVAFWSENYETGEEYNFQFVMTDLKGKEHRYEVSGIDMERKIREVF